MAHSKLSRINNLLLVVIILVNLYVLVVPFLPEILFRVAQTNGNEQQLQETLTHPPDNTDQGNRLVIPAMQLDHPISSQSNMYQALDEGIWRWPDGSTPADGSNTVLAAHRFTYTQPRGVFYFLNKLSVGDAVGIIWEGKTYRYTVQSVQIVHPDQTDVLEPTDEPTLTMYTCTPLWLPKDRLVITARLEATYE